MGKSFAIDCTLRFDKKSEVYFYRLLKEEQLDLCNSQKKLDSSQQKLDLQLSFCVNMLNLGVNPYPYILH